MKIADLVSVDDGRAQIRHDVTDWELPHIIIFSPNQRREEIWGQESDVRGFFNPVPFS